MRSASMPGIALVLTLSLVLSACTTVPKETVTLSETVAQQTVALQTAHETLATRYYGEMRNRVDEFMKDVWIPAFLAKAVNNQAVQSQMTSTLAAANLDTDAVVRKINADNSLSAAEKGAITAAVNKAKIDGRAQFGDLMIRFSEEAQRQIGLQRQSLLAPIDQQEQLVLEKLRATYATLQSEQATIKAFLASAVQVQAQQDQILQQLNLLDTRTKVLNDALAISDQASAALTVATTGEAGVAQFLESLKKVNQKLSGSTTQEGTPNEQ